MRTTSLKSAFSAVALALGLSTAGTASAAPILQLYIEDANYVSSHESWYTEYQQFRLWAIGNLSGPGGTGGLPITEVRLIAVYDDPGAAPVVIKLTPALIGETGSYGGFHDPWKPFPLPKLEHTISDGSLPYMGGNKYLPGHGEYGTGREWQEFSLPDFAPPADSQLGNFIHTFPVPGISDQAQIHAYDVEVTGAKAHFDLFGRVTDARGRTAYIFAPPSHDATDGPLGEEALTAVPVPATLALLGIGALGLGLSRRKPQTF